MVEKNKKDGIVEDSVELLTYIYKEYAENNNTHICPENVDERFDWEKGRRSRAIKYLNDQGLIKINILSASKHKIADFSIFGLTPEGIKTIEDKKEFKNKFGVEIGIPGIIKGRWSKEEK